MFDENQEKKEALHFKKEKGMTFSKKIAKKRLEKKVEEEALVTKIEENKEEDESESDRGN